MIRTPYIVRETAAGLERLAIPDILFQLREVQFIDEINAEAVDRLILQLRYLEHVDPEAPITMYINSPGGTVPDGLALYDVMQAITCPVNTVCIGTAASMAAVLFAGGHERAILPHAQVMIHDPLIPDGVGGSALKVARVSEKLLETRQIIADIIALHTGKSRDEILGKTAEDCFFTAQEAVDFGLADKIIDKI